MAQTENRAAAEDNEAVTREWLERLIRHENSSPTDIARRAGVPQTTLTRFLRRDSHKLLGKTLARLAKVSPLELPASLQMQVDTDDVRQQVEGVSSTTVNSRDLPVWGVIPVGKSGEFRLNPIPVAAFPRPAHLASGRRIAIFYASDESMAPRWEEGEPVVVDLARPATPGSFALVKLTPPGDPDDTETHVFRRYIGRRNGVIELTRADGTAETIPISRVLEVRRVLDWKDLLA